MKKIIVFGASGRTGSQIVKLALNEGYEVTACVRNPENFSITHKKLIVVKGDVLQPNSFAGVISGNDIVVSAIGSGNTKATTLWSQGLGNIIAAMKANNQSRLICISAGGIDVNPLNGWFIRFMTKNVLQKILKEPYADLQKMETIVKHTNLNYTIVRPPRLVDKPLTAHYRSSINTNLPNTSSLSREDLAHFIVNHLEDEHTFKSTVHLSY